MSAMETFVIVGAGLAGAKAAESLRGWRFDGRIVLVGAENEAPYERPPLSKAYLRGRATPDDIRVHHPDYYWRNGIELRTGTRVTEIDTRRQLVGLDPGGRLPYDRLLLATGAKPRIPAIPGSGLAGVVTLRTPADADTIRCTARTGARVLVLGTGWIGGEVAASLRRAGVTVTMVGRDAVPFERSLGRRIGAIYREVHREHGVDLRMRRTVTEFIGDKTLTGARLDDGTTVSCDLAVVAVGVRPSVELAEAAGITTKDGIVTDRFLRTSARHVFAAGDVAAVDHPMLDGHLRTGHSWSALTQGPVAAANMLGHPTGYDWIPYFSSRQYDFDVEYTGHATADDEVVYRGDPASRTFVAFWIRDRRLRAALNAGWWGTAPVVKKLIAAAVPVEPDMLADEDVPLADLLPAGARPLRRPLVHTERVLS